MCEDISLVWTIRKRLKSQNNVVAFQKMEKMEGAPHVLKGRSQIQHMCHLYTALPTLLEGKT